MISNIAMILYYIVAMFILIKLFLWYVKIQFEKESDEFNKNAIDIFLYRMSIDKDTNPDNMKIMLDNFYGDKSIDYDIYIKYLPK